MNGKRAIKKNLRNWPVKKSLRLVKAGKASLSERENRDEANQDKR